jgi:hypothetical protein
VGGHIGELLPYIPCFDGSVGRFLICKHGEGKTAGDPNDVFAAGVTVEVMGDIFHDREVVVGVANAVVGAVEEDFGHVRGVSLGIERGEQELLVVGESLDEVQAVGKDDQGEARAVRLTVDELDELLASEDVRAVVGTHNATVAGVDHVVEEQVEGALFGLAGKVDEGVRRDVCGEHARPGVVRMRIEGKDALRLSVFLDGEVFFRQVAFRVPLRI